MRAYFLLLCSAVLLCRERVSGFAKPPLRANPAVRSSGTPLALQIPISGSIPTIDAVLCVAAVVAFHEAGHFVAAKVQRIKIDSYNIGYGPKILSYKKDERSIDYALRLLPFGGYVAFPSNIERNEETGEVTELSDPDLLENRPPLQKALVIASGVLANLLLAFLLAAYSSLSTGISRPTYGEGVAVTSVSEAFGANSPAKIVRLLPADVIVAVSDASGITERIVQNDVPHFVSYIRAHPNTEISLQIQRGKQLLDKKITPVDVSGSGTGTIGVNVNANVVSTETVRAGNLGEAAVIGSVETVRLLQSTVDGLVNGVRGGLTAGNIGGPISIVREGARLAETSPRALVGFSAALSVNLAVLNSLPVPALDGGQFVFVLIEQITGKKLPKKVQENLYLVAFAVFFSLTITAFFNDIGGLGATLSR